MGKEIQLETAAQHGVFDFPDPALPGGAGVRDDDVDTAEMHGDTIERPTHRRAVGHVAFDPERRAAELFRCRLGGRGIDVEQRHFGARTAHRTCRGEADRTARHR